MTYVRTICLLLAAMSAASCASGAPVADNRPGVTVIVLQSETSGNVGVVVDARLRVVTVEAGGTAEQAGMRVGDVIAALNGVPVSSIAELRQALADALLLESQPTEILSTTPGAQEILDATSAAVQAQTPASEASAAVSIELLRGDERVTVRVARQPSRAVGERTPTPVPDEFWYF